ncbi:hypothetical protein ABIE45_006279 [Methylobacterium sp. OAE515]|uniref:hypothetical protein n=1 Tax=Methylobacterium sp. OAE515 TaxID=2817895 RepID=UPI00178AF459
MVDLAEAVEAFALSDEGRAYRDADSLLAACLDRWPDLTQAAFDREFGTALAAMRAELCPPNARQAGKSSR